MKKEITTLLATIFFTLSCNCTFAKEKMLISEKPQREIEFQIINTNDIEKVMLGVCTTLQDSDFVIQEYEHELGFIRAKKYYKKKHLNKKRITGESLKLAALSTYAVFTYGSTAYHVADPTRRLYNEFHSKTVEVDANIIIEPTADNKTKVRFVFLQKVLQNADGYSFVKSTPTKILRTYEPEIYQEFFTQLNNNIFNEGT